MKTYALFSFSSSHHAIAAEAVTSGGCASADEGLTEARLIPLPPEISAGCGLVLRVNGGGIKEAARLLAEAEIPYTGTYLLKTEKSERIVEKYDLS
ncbi:MULTISPECIES: DUF3343 domain-containing protein [unclassified Treponema]|uniref:DUF3343 domain-containing protein n=1 Tax=unclassified Treponema TaxID=2638727 RepID=UPI0020A45163|nr:MULTISPECIES: DUF3343 domain-containing protein [unclassified Treponema]UTC66408.1 DUF3343 domain-containing protein [Treponema sp. OMZ 789]UTC69138.1 DUF3343 domain-containing protein [Treponema sp. OMZ 790]UTC71850.1 DUF3343 domain-containing protein [Treponema sp. OMZ 791]